MHSSGPPGGNCNKVSIGRVARIVLMRAPFETNARRKTLPIVGKSSAAFAPRSRTETARRLLAVRKGLAC
jgi:hypothetical protein